MSATRVGVIGAGSLGFHHARILRSVPGAEMAGIYDSDPQRAAAVSAELGVRAFTSREALLEAVDAAVIAVPTTAHAEVALAALDAGVHLLIEKPIATTVQEADQIVAAAQRAGVVVATGHVERFNGALRACEQYLEDPRFAESHRLDPRPGTLFALASCEEKRGRLAAAVRIYDEYLALCRLAKEGKTLDKKVYELPKELDQEIAGIKLASMGVAIDKLTSEQIAYASDYSAGT